MRISKINNLSSKALIDFANDLGVKSIFLFVYSDGCYHCHQMKPHLEQALKTYTSDTNSKNATIYFIPADIFQHLTTEHSDHPTGILLSKVVVGFPTFCNVSKLSPKKSLVVDEFKDERNSSNIVKFFKKHEALETKPKTKKNNKTQTQQSRKVQESPSKK